MQHPFQAGPGTGTDARACGGRVTEAGLDLGQLRAPGFGSPPGCIGTGAGFTSQASPLIKSMSTAHPQSTTATASISTSHSGSASAAIPTRVLAGGILFAKKGARALPMMARYSGL